MHVPPAFPPTPKLPLLLLPFLAACAVGGPSDPYESGRLHLFTSRETATGPLVFSGEARLSGTRTVLRDGLRIPVDSLTIRLTQNDEGDDSLTLDLSGGPIAGVTTVRAAAAGDSFAAGAELPIDLRPLAGTPDASELCADDLRVRPSPASLTLALRDSDDRPTRELDAAARMHVSVEVLVSELRTSACTRVLMLDLALEASATAAFVGIPEAPGSDAGTDADADAGSDAGPEVDSDADPDTDTAPDPDTDSDSDSVPDPDPDSGPECLTDWDCGAGTHCFDGACEALSSEPAPEPAETLCSPGTEGHHGESCAGFAPETWRCMCHPIFGGTVSQVCRDGIWQSYHLNPRDCEACEGTYTSACRAP